MCTTALVFFIHSSVDKHWECFHILAIVNNVMIDTRVHISFEVVFLYSLDKYPKVGIKLESYGSSTRFLRNLHTIFHDGY